MSRPELKEKLTKLINGLDDDELLQQIYQLINDEKEVYKLSNEQKMRLAKAQEEIKKGHFIPHEQVKRRTAEWLKK